MITDYAEVTGNTLQLTAREIEICDLLADGLTAKHIAIRLNISHRTVQQHIYRIKIKTGIPSTKYLISIYINEGHSQTEHTRKADMCFTCSRF